MGRQLAPTARMCTRAALADRIRTLRVEVFGEEGVCEVAGRLGLPDRTWLNYELGVAIPGEVLLRFIELTDASPLWLLSGLGDRSQTADEPSSGRSQEAG